LIVIDEVNEVFVALQCKLQISMYDMVTICLIMSYCCWTQNLWSCARAERI